MVDAKKGVRMTGIAGGDACFEHPPRRRNSGLLLLKKDDEVEFNLISL